MSVSISTQSSLLARYDAVTKLENGPVGQLIGEAHEGLTALQHTTATSRWGRFGDTPIVRRVVAPIAGCLGVDEFSRLVVPGHDMFYAFPYCRVVAAAIDGTLNGSRRRNGLIASVGAASSVTTRDIAERARAAAAGLSRQSKAFVDKSSQDTANRLGDALEAFATQVEKYTIEPNTAPAAPDWDWIEPEFFTDKLAHAVAFENAAVRYLANDSLGMRARDPGLDDSIREAVLSARTKLRSHSTALWELLSDDACLAATSICKSDSDRYMSEFLGELVDERVFPRTANALNRLRHDGDSERGYLSAGEFATCLEKSIRSSQFVPNDVRAFGESLAQVCRAFCSMASLSYDMVEVNRLLNGDDKIVCGSREMTVAEVAALYVDYLADDLVRKHDIEVHPETITDLRNQIEAIEHAGSLAAPHAQRLLIEALTAICERSPLEAVISMSAEDKPSTKSSAFKAMATVIHNFCYAPSAVLA